MLLMTLIYEPQREKEYLKHSKIGMQAADNVFQWNVIEGLTDNLGSKSFEVLNSVPVGNFPKANKKIRYRSEKKKVNGIMFFNIGFWNLPFIKPVSRFFSYNNKLIKLTQLDNRVLIYGLYLPQLLAIAVVKKFFRKAIEVTLIIDDLPAQYGIISGNFIKRILKKTVGQVEMQILNDKRIVDHFVFLTKQMSEVIKLNSRTFTVVEGIANINTARVNMSNESNKKIIFYGGTLNKKFGISSLLEAFTMLQGDEYELWICGDGDAKEEIENIQREDKRIHYYGYVDKRRADELMACASVLVNPRKNDANYTRYSFPSKTIEYLLTGKPVVMYKLDGIPDEYDLYLNYVDGETSEDLAKSLKRVCNTDYEQAKRLAEEGACWICEEKNSTAQIKKVLEIFNKDNLM